MLTSECTDSYRNSGLLDAVSRMNEFLLGSPVSVQLSFLSWGEQLGGKKSTRTHTHQKTQPTLA